MSLKIEPMSIDQLAGAVVLFLGAVGSLLLVVWQSRCHCRVNLCYIFTCERRPPSEEEMKTIKEKAKDLKDKKDLKNTDKKIEEKDVESLIPKSPKEENPNIKFDIAEKDNLI
jgi:hypothetical protein